MIVDVNEKQQTLQPLDLESKLLPLTSADAPSMSSAENTRLRAAYVRDVLTLDDISIHRPHDHHQPLLIHAPSSSTRMVYYRAII